MVIQWTLYRTVVRATGTGGRNRSVSNSDTPQGRYKILLLSAKVFPSDIKNRLNPHDEDSAFSFICFLLPKHINDEQKYTF